MYHLSLILKIAPYLIFSLLEKIHLTLIKNNYCRKILMKVVTTDFVAGAQQAEGITVIIDVFRAFSVACYCLAKNPKTIIPIGSVSDAISLKKQHSNVILIGEREGKKLPGFDYGNSPTELRHKNVTNKTIIHTTHAGTQGLVNAPNASEILTGAFVNAKATAEYIKSKAPEVVTLVRMGWKAEENTDEDDLCAEYLLHLLTNKPYDLEVMKKQLMSSPCVERFLDPEQPWNPKSDLELCLAFNRFDFAVKAETDHLGFIHLTKQIS